MLSILSDEGTVILGQGVSKTMYRYISVLKIVKKNTSETLIYS